MKVQETGFIDNGTGKHQSNVVYLTGQSYSDSNGNGQESDKDYRYGLCNGYSYCIDANYYKGTSFEQFIKKHRRQLIIERV